MDLTAHLTAVLRSLRLPAGPALVAVSGGPDSVALLDLLVETRGSHGLELIVAHADHGIHPDSGEVARRVELLAGAYGLRVVTGRLHLGAEHQYPTETAARTSRHGWLRQVAAREGAKTIFLAHHADDQAETVLFRALRGTGVAGLAGIAPVDEARRLLRPLLPFRRPALRRYARSHRLRWRDDPTNASADPAHNRIRLELLPRIERTVKGNVVRATVNDIAIGRGMSVELSLGEGVRSLDRTAKAASAEAKLQIPSGEPIKIHAAHPREGASGFYVQVVCHDPASVDQRSKDLNDTRRQQPAEQHATDQRGRQRMACACVSGCVPLYETARRAVRTGNRPGRRSALSMCRPDRECLRDPSS
jgi:tRNA(Ile)-lysidine synthetase-like protein